jgi:hypothetical protein
MFDLVGVKIFNGSGYMYDAIWVKIFMLRVN